MRFVHAAITAPEMVLPLNVLTNVTFGGKVQFWTGDELKSVMTTTTDFDVVASMAFG